MKTATSRTEILGLARLENKHPEATMKSLATPVSNTAAGWLISLLELRNELSHTCTMSWRGSRPDSLFSPRVLEAVVRDVLILAPNHALAGGPVTIVQLTAPPLSWWLLVVLRMGKFASVALPAARR